MPHDPALTLIYHITDVENLPRIIEEGALLSDAQMADRNHAEVIGYPHIKLRRLREIPVPCCENRFVGEFVPFYLCPRSPMLFTINKGNTGRPPGCQSTIVHLVSTAAHGMNLGRSWAVSDRNAGAFIVEFYSDEMALDRPNWEAIEAHYWQNFRSEKCAEFLVQDSLPWACIQSIGCHNMKVVARVQEILEQTNHRPAVTVEPTWYY